MHGKASRFGRARRVALALASVALALAALETGIWLAHAVMGGKPRLLRSDPDLGWANRRNFTAERKLGDGRRWRVSLDEDGHRTLDLAQRPDLPRLVALGDSFVFGDGVNPEAHFLSEVGRRLPASVANLGVVGYSTDQELLAFRRYRGNSDVVLLGTYLTNDLDGNLSHSGGNLLRFKPKFAGCPDTSRLSAVRHPWINRARHRSYVVTLALGGLRRVAPGLALFDSPTQDDRAVAWECYASLVDGIVEEAEHRGAAQVVILLWSFHSSRPDPRAATALDARYAGRPVQVIDLDRLVAQRGVDPASLYYSPAVDPGAHWNAAGHAFVAGAVLDAIAEVSRGDTVLPRP